MYDVIILGGGPGGLTAGIYLKRAGLDTVLIEENFLGGQIATTDKVENYPGFISISGMDLANSLEEQAKSYDLEFIVGEKVKKVSLKGAIKKVFLGNNKIVHGRTIILATGCGYKKLNIKGESEFLSKGVHYCATCDGALYMDKEVMVIGGGDTALTESIFLSRYCKKVYLVHRRDEFKGTKILSESVRKNDKIEILLNSELKEIYGETTVNKVKIINNLSGEEIIKNIDGIFIAIGHVPNTNLFKDEIKLDNMGYIMANDLTLTSEKGVFAVGDVREKELRQVVTAVSDGAISSYEIEKYIMEN